MELALTFGSVGDLLAICLIVKDIIYALDDSRGSAKDYRDIIAQLQTFDGILTQISQGLTGLESIRTLDGIRPLISQCLNQSQRCLETFREEIRKYSTSLSSSSPAGRLNRLKRSYKKVMWKLDDQVVDKFRRDLTGHYVSLGVFLSVIQV
ncbi:hypothetical protein ACHAQH_002290 [Verticillium albo-atrum]